MNMHWYLATDDGNCLIQNPRGKFIRFSGKEEAEAIANIVKGMPLKRAEGGLDDKPTVLVAVELDLPDDECTEEGMF